MFDSCKEINIYAFSAGPVLCRVCSGCARREAAELGQMQELRGEGNEPGISDGPVVLLASRSWLES